MEHRKHIKRKGKNNGLVLVVADHRFSDLYLEDKMSWILWAMIGIIAANVLFFGSLALVDRIERRRK